MARQNRSEVFDPDKVSIMAIESSLVGLVELRRSTRRAGLDSNNLNFSVQLLKRDGTKSSKSRLGGLSGS